MSRHLTIDSQKVSEQKIEATFFLSDERQMARVAKSTRLRMGSAKSVWVEITISTADQTEVRISTIAQWRITYRLLKSGLDVTSPNHECVM